MSMVLFQNWWKSHRAAAAVCCLFAAPLFALQVPAGTEINLRLKTKVASNSSKPKEPVEAMVIQPVAVNGEFAVPAGATVHGAVVEAKASSGPEERALLQIA